MSERERLPLNKPKKIRMEKLLNEDYHLLGNYIMYTSRKLLMFQNTLFLQTCKFIPDYTISHPENSNFHSPHCEDLKSHKLDKVDESF
jgi:hypothetical protein